MPATLIIFCVVVLIAAAIIAFERRWVPKVTRCPFCRKAVHILPRGDHQCARCGRRFFVSYRGKSRKRSPAAKWPWIALLVECGLLLLLFRLILGGLQGGVRFALVVAAVLVLLCAGRSVQLIGRSFRIQGVDGPGRPQPMRAGEGSA